MKILLSPYPLQRQRGVALIASLLIMLLMTIVALSIFRNNNLTERLSGGTRDKQRAFQVAQSALAYGEWWLTQQTTSTLTPVTCSTTTNFTNLQVCTVAAGSTASTIATLKNYQGFAPTNMVINSSGGLAANGDINYSQKPGIYIATNGILTATGQTLYQVTAIGYGGTSGKAGAEAVVQSYFVLNASSVSGGGTTGGSGAHATSGNNLGGA